MALVLRETDSSLETQVEDIEIEELAEYAGGDNCKGSFFCAGTASTPATVGTASTAGSGS